MIGAQCWSSALVTEPGLQLYGIRLHSCLALSLGGSKVLPFGMSGTNFPEFPDWNPFHFLLLINGVPSTQEALFISPSFTPLDPFVNCWSCCRAFRRIKSQEFCFLFFSSMHSGDFVTFPLSYPDRFYCLFYFFHLLLNTLAP